MRRYFFWTLICAIVGVALAYSVNEGARAAYAYLSTGHNPVVYQVAGLFSGLQKQAVVRPIPPAKGKAILVDFAAMRLELYENGEPLDSVSILAKGKRGTPWETPSGNYAVMAKNAKGFSLIDKVWLPSEVSFLGNFAIHGEPYAQNGKSLPASYSGGCIRLASGDAKRVFDFAELGTPVLVFDIPPNAEASIKHYELKPVAKSPAVSARAYLLADLDSEEILEAKNTTAVFPIASVSKLMTALVSLDHLNQDEIVTVSKRAVATEGNSGNLRAGEKIKVGDLIYPLLLASSNDAAEALAESYGRDKFLKLMNEKAKAIGLANTSFEDPSGLSPHNVSTAEDLYKLGKYIYSNKPYIFDISATLGHTTVNHSWFNTNDLAAAAYFLGGKNGFTDEARQTMLSLWSIPFSAEENRRLVLVALNSADRKTDAETLLHNINQAVSYKPHLVSSPILTAVASVPKAPTTLTLVLVGDIMLARGVEQSVVKNGGGDFSWLFKNVGDLSSFDILFGNLEGPLSDQGKNLGSQYSFRMSPKALPALAKLGFDALSVANNHAGDWGKEAFGDSVPRLSQANILPIGGGANFAEASRVKIVGKNGYRVGFLGASDVGPKWLAAGDNQAGIILADDPRWPEIIKKAASQVDVLVVSYHFGNEYEKEPTERQRYLARLAIDQGARIVVGHHPHVVQTVEKYKNGIIAYSLGNFVFDQFFSAETMSGLVLKVKFENNEITEAGGVYTTLNSQYQPSLQHKDEE